MIELTTTNPDSTPGGSTAPLRTGGSYAPGDSTGARASSGNGHDRVHRLAGTMHRAIDSIEQRLGSAGGGVSSTQARYAEQARHYRDSMRMRMNDQPLQVAGIVLAAGVLLDRLLLRQPRVRVIQVPARTPATWVAAPEMERHRWVDTAGAERRLHRWGDAADEHLHRVGRAGREAAGMAGMAAASGIAGTRAAASQLAHEAQALPLQMRMAAQRLMARSQAYGSRARSTVEAHPWAGPGAVLAASGLLTTLMMRRRDPMAGPTYAATDERRIGWSRSDYDTQAGVGEMIASRPVTASVLVLGLGMLAGVLLGRRME